MGLTFYSAYMLTYKFIYTPLRALLKYSYINSQPLDKLSIYYGKGTVVVVAPTIGLGPAYCKKLIDAGFNDFLLIDEDSLELNTLMEDLE